MTFMNDLLHSPILFWMAWVIIPIVMEIIPTVFDFFILLKRKIFRKKEEELQYCPEITLIIPVYNSAETLYACIKSINDSTYDSKLIYIMLVNNESTDDSFQVYCQCQEDFPELTITWMNSEQGKSKALNLALFNSYGKYIIHIDSDGVLHPEALYNMVRRFEGEDTIDCLTGTIMTNPEMIDETKSFPLRLLRKLEFFEYCQAFLAGRNFQSEFNSIFTLSGAFSAFRKSAILKTQLYNTDTICEDTHVTFQIRDTLKEQALCEDAYFFVDPIEDLNRLYIQRQRWQRGEIEVMHMFKGRGMFFGKGFLSDFVIRLLMYDHTFAFPRMIWYFALICLAFIGYPFRYILISLVLIYVMYVLSAFLYYIHVCIYLHWEKKLWKFYACRVFYIFLLPLFNFMVYWFRFAGIINSIKGARTWRTRGFDEEMKACGAVIAHDFAFVKRAVSRLKKLIYKA